MPHVATFSDFRFFSAIQSCIQNQSFNTVHHTDWLKWRFCYQGGDDFRDEFLKEFVGSVGQEGDTAFERRRDLTPIPTFAKTEINKIKNSVGRRLRDIRRSGGTDVFQDSVQGNGRGVDLRGSSMNSYITKKLLAELLVMGRVGVLVDAPVIRPMVGREVISRADVPRTFQPYLNRFTVEQTPILIEAPSESPSDWSHVLIETVKNEFNLITGKADCVTTFRYYWLEEDDPVRRGKVNTIFLDASAQPTSEIIHLDIDAIPFVEFRIDNSLMIDVCSYQIALLNMISADSSYAIDSNFSFLTRMGGGTDIGDHMEGGDGDETTRIGTDRGLNYGKGLERPGFISPPSEPMEASVSLRREMKTEVKDLIHGALEDLGTDGSVEAGLGAIGDSLLCGESRLWDHWTVYEDRRPAKRLIATISYPITWTLKTDAQRLDEAEKFIKLGNLVVGRKNKQQMAISAVESLHGGTVSTEKMNGFLDEIKASPIAIADPSVLLAGKKEGALSIETVSIALGARPDEHLKAKADSAERAAAVAVAQKSVNDASRGNPDGMNDNNDQTLAREGETEGAANFKKPGDPGRPNDDLKNGSENDDSETGSQKDDS